jgi:hypothetical protein
MSNQEKQTKLERRFYAAFISGFSGISLTLISSLLGIKTMAIFGVAMTLFCALIGLVIFFMMVVEKYLKS